MTDPEAKEPFVINRIKAFKYAFKGAWLLIKNEPSIQVQSQEPNYEAALSALN